jgi:hypothetical protein
MAAHKLASLAAVLGLALAGCSGMNGSSMTPGVPSGPAQSSADTQAAAPSDLETPDRDAASPEQAPGAASPAATASGPQRPAANAARAASGNTGAIGAIGALGSTVKTYSDETANEPGSQSAKRRSHATGGQGKCRAGVEFFSPDRAGDANSTETLNFFDAACTQLARDAVRKWTAGTTPGSETVARTVKMYAQGSSTPIGLRTDTTAFTNGTFTTNGFPVVASGFARTTASQLLVGTQKNVLSDTETVMAPSTSSVNSYCTDSAGYNAVGLPNLGLSFGWQGGAFTGGTRTLNADTSVTWKATHAGQTESAPIGQLAIASGARNTACPIVTPAYTLTGGTAKGNYTIPISVTFLNGVIRNLTITNAALASGYTLNVTTNTMKWPASTSFVTGTVTSGTTVIATFAVSAFGNGSLTVAATGNRFAIVDWNVVR